jgi:hypothetical protein
LIGESKSYDDVVLDVLFLFSPLYLRENREDARLPPNSIHQNYQTFKEKTMLYLASDFSLWEKNSLRFSYPLMARNQMCWAICSFTDHCTVDRGFGSFCLLGCGQGWGGED